MRLPALLGAEHVAIGLVEVVEELAATVLGFKGLQRLFDHSGTQSVSERTRPALFIELT